MILLQSAMISVILLGFFEAVVLGIYEEWTKLAALNVINVGLLLMLLFWNRQPLTFSWVVVCSCLILIIFSPSVMSSSIALLTLFLCYTMMPLQLRSSALAASLLSIAALSKHLLDTVDTVNTVLDITQVINRFDQGRATALLEHFPSNNLLYTHCYKCFNYPRVP